MARSTQGVASTMPWVGAFRRALSVGSMMQADLETTGRVALDACFSAGYCSRLTIGRREHVSCSDAFLWIALLSLLIAPASAQPSEVWRQCANQQNASFDQHSGCNTDIPSGMEAKKNAAAYYSSGNAHLNKRDYDRAIADYDQAIELDPKYAIVYVYRGNAYQAKKDYDRAVADYDKA